VIARAAEKSEETVVIRKEKEPKRKENRPAGKVENAMNLRFPLSHRACYQKQGNDRGIRTQINKEGRPVGRHHASAGPGRSGAVTNRRLTPQFLVVATPQF